MFGAASRFSYLFFLSIINIFLFTTKQGTAFRVIIFFKGRLNFPVCAPEYIKNLRTPPLNLEFPSTLFSLNTKGWV